MIRRLISTHLLALLSAAAASTAAGAVRDPFWPIGYSPAPPPSLEPVVPAEPVVAEPVKPPPPPPPSAKPITEYDWARARKALKVSGFTKSVMPDTQETRTFVMINRQTYTAGETLVLQYGDIRFCWRVESVADNDFSLAPIKAERGVPKPSDLKSAEQPSALN